MVYVLYDLLLCLSAVVLVPYYILRGMRYGKTRRGIRERLGLFKSDQLKMLVSRRVIWIHAVSVGETRAAIPLVKSLRKKYPDVALVLSNVTETGRAIAKDISEIDLCIFAPFDLSWSVRRAIGQLQPSLVLIVETELWPNFLKQLHQRHIPVLLVNGRFSDRSFPRYLMARRIFRPLLRMVTAFCMQSDQDARRARRIGAPPGRVHVTGNLKFDITAKVPDDAERRRLRAVLNLPADVPVWVAGSTHAGEEEIVARICRELAVADVPQLLILVPRHPERARSVGEMLASQGLSWVLRSEIDRRHEPLRNGEVLLVDSIGEMLDFYAVANLVFVGGSLVPVGGHNILEASLLSKPVLFGPHMHNFKEISALVLAAGGGCQVADEAELKLQIRQLLRDPVRCREMGNNGHTLLAGHAGATVRTLSVIEGIWGE
jgi:3-deoxy-D-manno-octulosonic-acid transferase